MSNDSLVLCLYAGGTIGMVKSDATSGFAPYPSFLTETLRSQARFHDPKGDSIFSWSDTAARYKAWSETYTRPSSGTATPRSQARKDSDKAPTLEGESRVEASLKKELRPLPLHADSAAGPYSLRSDGSDDDLSSDPHTAHPQFGPPVNVLSSAPNGTSKHHAISSRLVNSDQVLELSLPTLITPPGAAGQRVRYAVLEYDPLLDSSEMGIHDWIRLATDISLNYKRFDAFIVLHGTDTMAYTSSALSMLLENLGKSVILTGAQVPLSQLRNDAIENLLGALTLAGSYIIPEVTLYFASTLYRGNRASKVSNTALAAFDTPNMPPLAHVGINIDVAWHRVERPHELIPFRAHNSMSHNVAVLRLFPGLSTATVRSFLSEPLEGAVLESFGAGNAPSRPDLLDAFREARDRGVVIVNITQCLQGEVSSIYALGKKLEAVGVVAGRDMTPECALARLSYLLGKKELSRTQVRELVGQPLRGESTLRGRPVTSQPAKSSSSTDVSALLTHILRLHESGRPATPTPGDEEGVPVANTTQVTTSSITDATAALATILPYLLHHAAVLNDLPALQHHLSALQSVSSLQIPAHQQLPASDAGSKFTADTNLNPVDRAFALHAASVLGHVHIVEALLRAGASVHVRDLSGTTPLELAEKAKRGQVVAVLEAAGAHRRIVFGSDVESQ